MGYRRRIYFTEKQKTEIWDRWQRGESMSSIGRRFDRNSSSIYPLLAWTGGIRPAVRRRSQLALTLAEREEISRGLRAQLSLRAIDLCVPSGGLSARRRVCVLYLFKRISNAEAARLLSRRELLEGSQ
jgi:hypothetical protein